MTVRIFITEGTEITALREARFAAWLEVEKASRRNEIEGDVSKANLKREKWNALPLEDRDRINEQRALKGLSFLKWPLKPLKVPKQNNEGLKLPHSDYPSWPDPVFFTPRRIKLARLACSMTKAEWDSLHSDFNNKISKLNRYDFQDAQDALAVWECGEEIRDRNARVEFAKQKAMEIISKRKVAQNCDGLDFTECFRKFGPEGGDFHSGSKWQASIWDRLPEKIRKTNLKEWERVERLLPIYYEYARQSVKLLQLAIIYETIKTEMPETERISERESSKPCLEGCAMHPLESVEREGVQALHSKIGGYAEAVIKSLGKFLANDVPYPLVPLNERKWAASFVMSCNESHSIMGPNLTDAGPVLDPWVVGQVERERVRLATNEEASQTANISYRVIISKKEIGRTIKHEDLIEFDKALHATTKDQQTIDKRSGAKVHSRALDDDGGEVVALKIVWKDTRDGELVEAFSNLIKKLRPRKPMKQDRYQFLPEAHWPERPASKKRGSKWETEAMAALNGLIAAQKKQAAMNSWIAAREEGRKLKRELKKGGWTATEQAHLEAAIRRAEQRENVMGTKSKNLTLPGAKLARITACFKKIIGDDELPWWKRMSAKSD